MSFLLLFDVVETLYRPIRVKFHSFSPFGSPFGLGYDIFYEVFSTKKTSMDDHST